MGEGTRYIFMSVIDEKEKKVLDVLAASGPMTCYRLRMETDIPHTTLFTKLKKMVKKGLIEVVGEEVFRTGLKKKYYDVTEKGFRRLLHHAFFEVIDNIGGGLEAVGKVFSSYNVLKSLGSIAVKENRRSFLPVFEVWEEWGLSNLEYLSRVITLSCAEEGAKSIEECFRILTVIMLNVLFHDEVKAKEVEAGILPLTEIIFPLASLHVVEQLRSALEKELRRLLEANPWMKAKMREIVLDDARQLEKTARVLREIGGLIPLL